MKSRCSRAFCVICSLSGVLLLLRLSDAGLDGFERSGEVIKTYGFSEHNLETTRFLSSNLEESQQMPVTGHTDAMFMVELSFHLVVVFSCVARRELFDSETLTPDRPGACSSCDPAPISTSTPNVAVSLLPSFASCSSSSMSTSACLFKKSLMLVSLVGSAFGDP